MIKNNYKYNEIEYVDAILNNGFQTNHIYTEMCLMVVYYRDFEKAKPKERKEKLYKFCEQFYPGFDRFIHFKQINKALRAAQSPSRLVSVPYVNVYKNDMDFIDRLPLSYEVKKVLFTFLIYMRLDKTYRELKYDKEYNNIIFYGDNQKYNYIKNMSNISPSLSICKDIIPKLSELNLVTILYRGKIVLNFLNQCPQGGDVVLEVTNYDNIGLYYDLYNNKHRVAKCSYCGSPFHKRSNCQKNCNACKIMLKPLYHREYDRVRYEKSKK